MTSRQLGVRGRTPIQTPVAPLPGAHVPSSSFLLPTHQRRPIPTPSLPSARPIYFMSPSTPPNHDPRFRRRGRQPTACTECNRRKQRCDGRLPCHHCAKRNVEHLCRFPDQQKPMPRLQDTSSVTFASPPGHSTSGSGSDSSSSFVYPKRKSSFSQMQRSPKRVSLFEPPPLSPDASTARFGIALHTSPVAMHSPSVHSESPNYPPSRRRPSLQDLVHHSIPVSSERHEVHTPPPQWSGKVEAGSPLSSPRPAMAGTRTPDSWGSHHEDGVLMQEGGAPGYGSLAVEGAGDEHGREFQFYGTSHFGPRAAAQFFQAMSGSRKTSVVDVSDAHYGIPIRARSEDELGPDTLASHIRQLDGRLPHRSLCERYVNSFFNLANSWMDMLYEPDFREKYATFWSIKGEFEDMTRIDVRWFALFHVVLAFGALLDRGHKQAVNPESLSYQFFVGARRALSEAPSFGGESIDTVRAYALLSHYLVMTRRVPEAWNMLGNAVRASEAQGFHIDGDKWKDLAPKEAELRRRLWAQLYCLDRSISYFLGRPLAIHDDKFSVSPPSNLPDDELSTLPRPNWPLTSPTKSTFLILHFRLAYIIGRILTTCFGLSPRKHYDVMECEYAMVEWMKSLPPVFNFDRPDLSWDEQYPWLRLQRQTLISKFHQARISLHRPYLLHQGYQESRLACVLSAGAELQHRLALLETDLEALDRFKWMTVASGFAPASVLGLLLARNKREEEVYDYDQVRTLFTAYIAAEKRVPNRDHTTDCEMKVLDMMLAKANAVDLSRREGESKPPSAPRTPAPTHAALPRAMQISPLVIPPEHMHLGARPEAPRGPLSINELTIPSRPASQRPEQHPNQADSQMHQAPQAQLQYQPQVPQHCIVNPQDQFLFNTSLTLAPTVPPEEWLPFCPRPWEPRPPCDPSAAAFPAADDMQSWAGLLNFIGTPAEPWFDSEGAVVIEGE